MHDQEIDLIIQDIYFQWMGVVIGDKRISSARELEYAAENSPPDIEKQARLELSRMTAARPMLLKMIASLADIRKGQRIFNTDEGLVIKSETLTRNPYGDKNPYQFMPDFEVMTRVKDLLLLVQRG